MRATIKPDGTDVEPSPFPKDCIVGLKRPDGTVKLVRVPGEHWERVLDLASGEFGDKNIILNPEGRP